MCMYVSVSVCIYIDTFTLTYTQIHSNTHITLTYTVFECMWVFVSIMSVLECIYSESMDFHKFDDHVKTDPDNTSDTSLTYTQIHSNTLKYTIIHSNTRS